MVRVGVGCWVGVEGGMEGLQHSKQEESGSGSSKTGDDNGPKQTEITEGMCKQRVVSYMENCHCVWACLCTDSMG
jgi:hypothetical protein